MLSRSLGKQGMNKKVFTRFSQKLLLLGKGKSFYLSEVFILEKLQLFQFFLYLKSTIVQIFWLRSLISHSAFHLCMTVFYLLFFSIVLLVYFTFQFILMILTSVPCITICHDLDKGTMVNHDLARLTMIIASVPWLRTLGIVW